MAINSSASHVPGARVISMRGALPLKIRRQYELSFSSIIEGKPAMWGLRAREEVKHATEEAADQYEERTVSDTIQPSGAWQKRTYRFKCPSTIQSNLDYSLSFRMPEGDVKFMLDNLSLKEIEPR
jgi:hypothetical protein